jgi:hypothetical protein
VLQRNGADHLGPDYSQLVLEEHIRSITCVVAKMTGTLTKAWLHELKIKSSLLMDTNL